MDRGRPATELLISKGKARRIAANISKGKRQTVLTITPYWRNPVYDR
jgi:hypothetical protein